MSQPAIETFYALEEAERAIKKAKEELLRQHDIIEGLRDDREAAMRYLGSTNGRSKHATNLMRVLQRMEPLAAVGSQTEEP